MSHFAEPRTTSQAVIHILGSALAGLGAFLLDVSLMGILAAFNPPAWVTGLMRSGGRPGAMLVDFLLFALPVIGLFMLLALVWYRLFAKRDGLGLLLVLLGWLLPSLSIRLGMEGSAFGFLQAWVHWPELIIQDFSPLIGIVIGYYLAPWLPFREAALLSNARAPWPVWLASMAVLLVSLASLLFTPTYVARGMVIHPFLFFVIAIANIGCAVALLLRYALGALVYVVLQVVLMGVLLAEPAWLAGTRVTIREVALGGVLPLMVLLLSLAYRKHLRGWPLGRHSGARRP